MPADVEECLACELADGRRPLPGGLIHATPRWRVEHCIGPLGLGTLVVKPVRHVTALADTTDAEAEELGPLLRLACSVAGRLAGVRQVYACLWSHGDDAPVHIHYVVQPVTAAQVAAFGTRGPGLQEAMFARGELPDPVEVERISGSARALFRSSTVAGGEAGPAGL